MMWWAIGETLMAHHTLGHGQRQLPRRPEAES